MPPAAYAPPPIAEAWYAQGQVDSAAYMARGGAVPTGINHPGPNPIPQPAIGVPSEEGHKCTSNYTSQPLLQKPCRFPVYITCHTCKSEVMSQTRRKLGLVAVLGGFFMCLACCPCFWVPCCIPACLDVEHRCPHCGSIIDEVPPALCR